MATQSRMVPTAVFGAGIALFGFTLGSTIALASGEPVLSTGGLFAISMVAKSSLMTIAELWVESADRGTLTAETYAWLKESCSLGNGIIGCTVIIKGYSAGLIGPIGAISEGAMTAWLCYTIPRSESLEVAARV